MYLILSPPPRRLWMSIGLIGSLNRVFNGAIIILCHHLSPGGAWGATAIEYPSNLCSNFWDEMERLVWQKESKVALNGFCSVGFSWDLLSFWREKKNVEDKFSTLEGSKISRAVKTTLNKCSFYFFLHLCNKYHFLKDDPNITVPIYFFVFKYKTFSDSHFHIYKKN